MVSRFYCKTANSGWVCPPFSNSPNVTLAFDVPTSAPSFDLEAGMIAQAEGNGLVDAIHTAQLSLSLPAGVTYTSASGVLLSQVPQPTTTTLVSSANPAAFGAPLSVTATVTGSDTAAPTGSVQFLTNGTAVGSPVAVTPGSGNLAIATLPLNDLTVANSPYAITAQYTNSDGAFINSSGLLTGGQVISQAATSTSVDCSPNPATDRENVVCTATVKDTSGGPPPTGSVQFIVDGSSHGTPVALTTGPGSASTAQSGAISGLSVSDSPHTIRAQFLNADGNFSDGAVGELSGGLTVLSNANGGDLNDSAPPIGQTPELDSLVLFGTGAMGFLSYLGLRRRARRRDEAG